MYQVGQRTALAKNEPTARDCGARLAQVNIFIFLLFFADSKGTGEHVYEYGQGLGAQSRGPDVYQPEPTGIGTISLLAGVI